LGLLPLLRREDFRRVFEKLGYRTSTSDYREAGPRSQIHGSAINGPSLVLGSWAASDASHDEHDLDQSRILRFLLWEKVGGGTCTTIFSYQQMGPSWRSGQ
jgi:hypothetical protein